MVEETNPARKEPDLGIFSLAGVVGWLIVGRSVRPSVLPGPVPAAEEKRNPNLLLVVVRVVGQKYGGVFTNNAGWECSAEKCLVLSFARQGAYCPK